MCGWGGVDETGILLTDCEYIETACWMTRQRWTPFRLWSFRKFGDYLYMSGKFGWGGRYGTEIRV